MLSVLLYFLLFSGKHPIINFGMLKFCHACKALSHIVNKMDFFVHMHAFILDRCLTELTVTAVF